MVIRAARNGADGLSAGPAGLGALAGRGLEYARMVADLRIFLLSLLPAAVPGAAECAVDRRGGSSRDRGDAADGIRSYGRILVVAANLPFGRFHCRNCGRPDLYNAGAETRMAAARLLALPAGHRRGPLADYASGHSETHRLRCRHLPPRPERGNADRIGAEWWLAGEGTGRAAFGFPRQGELF